MIPSASRNQGAFRLVPRPAGAKSVYGIIAVAMARGQLA
jgi:hypothetical protein